MKKFLFILMALWAVTASAQDVIIKKDGSTIVSKVLEITSTEVKYKKFTNQNGPTYTIPKTEILAINYENGEKETFGEVKAEGEKPDTQQQTGTPSIINHAPKVSDQQLLGMVGEYKYMDNEQKAKKLKIAGWCIGPPIILTGIVCLGMGLSWLDVDDNYKSQTRGTMILAGISGIIVGSTASAVCLSRAKKLEHQTMHTIHTVPIYHQDYALRNGSSLSTGVDVLSDLRIHAQTVGLGLRYNF